MVNKFSCLQEVCIGGFSKDWHALRYGYHRTDANQTFPFLFFSQFSQFQLATSICSWTHSTGASLSFLAIPMNLSKFSSVDWERLISRCSARDLVWLHWKPSSFVTGRKKRIFLLPIPSNRCTIKKNNRVFHDVITFTF